MSTPLSVLIVEDHPSDAELMVHELRRAGLDPDWRCVETEPEFLAAFSRTPNIILADHDLPQFGAPRVLELLKKSNIDVPLIVVTGSISEEVAVERIKQGAADYILKDRMTRLGEAVKRALEDRKLRDENFKAAADLQLRYRELQTLQEISQSVLNSLELSQVLDGILERTMGLGDFDLGVICLLDSTKDFLRTAAIKGYRDPQNAPRMRRPATEATTTRLASYALVRNEIHIEENVPGAEGLRGAKKEGVHSLIAVPVRAGEAVLGVLQLGSRTPKKFQPEETRLLEAIGNHVGIAVQKAILHEDTKRNLERIRALHEIALAISSTLDLRVILEFLIDKIALFLPQASATTIRLLNKDSGLLQPVACQNINEAVWKGEEGKAEHGLANAVLETKAPLMFRNAQADSRTRDHEFFRRYGLVSYLGVPLIARREVLGVLGFYTKYEHQFSNEEVEFLNTLAGQAAIAIHNAHLHEETERRRREAEELTRVARALTGTLDMTAVAERIVASVHELFGAKHATLRLLHPEGSLRALASSGEVLSGTPGGEAIPPGTGLTSRAVAEGRPICSVDMLNDPEIHLTDRMRDYQLRTGNRSMIAVPLRANEKIIGALVLADKTGRTYSASEAALIQAFADQAALALENARLYHDVDSSKTELELTNQYLEGSIKRLSGLYTALAPLTSSESPSEMLDGIIDRLMDATGADAVQIRLLNKDSKRLVSAGQRGFPDHYLKAVEIAPPGGAADWVFRTEEPIIAPDIAKDPRMKGKVQLQVGLLSCAMLPLKVHNEIRGIVHMASFKLGYFDEEQKDHLMAIARQMGIALDNRELFDEVKASNVELERSNKVKDEFLSVMSHELRTPLNVVVGYAGMIKDKMLGEINPKQAEACTKIIRRTNDLLWMVNSILYTTSLEANKVRVDAHEVNLETFLKELKSAYEVPLANQVALTWDCPPNLPVIKSDGAKLKHILDNLISNALKFTESGSVTVSARFMPEANAVVFAVRDTGIGISKEHLPSIFEKFKQLDSSETRLYSGVGLGLYIVKRFAELIGGQIDVESEPGKGSTFTVTLPYKI